MSGVGLGVLVGIWVNYIYSFQYSLYIYIGAGVLLFGYLGFTKQRTTEIMAYAASAYIILQVAWDFPVGDRGDIRLRLLISALVLLISNSFTGHYGWKTPQKIFKKALGVEWMKKKNKLKLSGLITLFGGVTLGYFIWLTWSRLTDWIGNSLIVWIITGIIVLVLMAFGYLSFSKIVEKFS